jgi:hypothetical protein
MGELAGAVAGGTGLVTDGDVGGCFVACAFVTVVVEADSIAANMQVAPTRQHAPKSKLIRSPLVVNCRDNSIAVAAG